MVGLLLQVAQERGHKVKRLRRQLGMLEEGAAEDTEWTGAEATANLDEALRNEVAAVTHENERLEGENEELKALVQELQAERTERERARKREGDPVALRETKELLEEQLARAQGTVMGLRSQIARMEATASEQAKMVMDLNATLLGQEEPESVLGRKVRECETLRAERDEAAKAKEDAEERLAQAEDRIRTRLGKVLEDKREAQEREKGLVDEVGRLQEKVKQLRKARCAGDPGGRAGKRARREARAMERERKALRERCEVAERSAGRAYCEREAALQEAARAKGWVEWLRRELKQAERELEMRDDGHDNVEESLQKRLQHAQQRASEYRDRLIELGETPEGTAEEATGREA